MVRAKICGITSWEDARVAIDAGADALGFNFYPPSPRSLAPAEAWGIIRRLPPFVETVGVFVNWPAPAILALARALAIHAVQLHGEESPAVVAAIAPAHPVIKAFRVHRGFRLSALSGYRAAGAFLLDGFDPRLPGGTGKRFDWSIARRARRYGRIVLAGGLTPANIARAILEARPFAVDVSSGVEARPGKKDPARLRELMRQVEIASLELHKMEGPAHR